MLKSWFAIPLWIRIFGALALGLAVGLLMGPSASVFAPLGTLFIRLIKMLVVPLIFISLVSGVLSMEDVSRLGRMGVKTLAAFLLTSMVAISIGLTMGNIMGPGVGAKIAGIETPETPVARIDPVQQILEIVPTNPIQAMADGTVLQIIFFALLVGFAIKLVGAPAEPVKRFFEGSVEVIFRITKWVMEFTPFGVFGLIASIAGETGIGVLAGLGLLALTFYLAAFLHMIIVPCFLVGVLGRLNPLKFYRGIFDAQMVAYSTSTSAGTLPVTMRCLQENIGVSRAVASFVAPTGVTINMDGTALYLGLVCVFASQAFGIPLGFEQYLTIILTGTLMSIGTAGIPSASLALMPLVLGPAGLPVGVVGLIATIDRPMDMMRTVANVTGDAAIATLIAASEGELDKKVFDHSPVA